jgi:S-(hydroxymethyl)glutathione dehydrogenase / alcohol dehydrogenase
MRAAVLWSWNEPFNVEDVELSAPRQGEVRVKLAASGVCHSDLSIQRGILPVPPPRIIGHEGAGTVEEVGPGVTSVAKGDHVILCWMYPCGHCVECGRGRPVHCETALATMMAGGMYDGTPRFKVRGQDMPHWVGSFAEQTVVPETACIKIRDDAPLDKACLVGCGVMTGIGAVINTARVEPGASVAVFGAGGVGLNVIQGAVLAGAEKIIAVDLLDSKLKLAQEFGATHTVNGKSTDAVGAIQGLTGGKGVDYAFEVIGAPPVIVQAFLSLRRGGKAVVVGAPPFGSEVTLPAFPFSMEEKSLIGSFYGSAQFHFDMPRIIDLYMAGRVKLDQLVTKKFPLADINRAMEAMESGSVARGVIQY